jgi:hypothetical protein
MSRSYRKTDRNDKRPKNLIKGKQNRSAKKQMLDDWKNNEGGKITNERT